jgi:HEAT repeat protein/energy-coupling factor transporter ATP-binding protein EcfA2
MLTTPLVNELASRLKRMEMHLGHAETGALLIASTAADLEHALADDLASRLDHAPLEFYFSPDRLSLPDYASHLSPPDGRGVIFAFGLSELSAAERATAIDTLNIGRESLRWAGYSIILWLRSNTLSELAFQSPDFYAVRSGLFDFDLPADSATRAETLAALQLHGPATLDELRRRYLDYVVATCRWLDFRGLLQVRNLVRLKLEDIFVPLSAEKEERFYVIELKGVDEKGIQAERDIFRLTVEKQRVELDAALRENSRLVILGDPGSGKSTLLKYLVLTFAEGEMQVRERLKLDESRLPILFPIAAYTLALREKPDLPLFNFLPTHFESLGLPNLAPLFEGVISNGKAILLLDGLDEVLDSETRSKVVRQVEALVAAHPRNRYVVTSRIAGYSSAALGPTFTTLTVRPFERREIESFARQWSRAYEALNVGRDAISPYLPPEAERRAEARAKSLTEAIFVSPSVERLATTPLLLTLLALIHYQGTRLPSRRVELYRLCVEALAETWNLARSLSGKPIELWLGERRLDEREVVNMLAPVAFYMHQRQPGGLISRAELEAQVVQVLAERRGEPPDRARKLASEFVNLIREQVGLLLERGPNQFGFMHLTFEEYLAARYIAGKREPFTLIKPHLYDPRWQEVILLTAASLEDEHASYYVGAIQKADGFLNEELHLDLLLAARCIADEVPVELRLRRDIMNKVANLVLRSRFERLRQEALFLIRSLRETSVASDVEVMLLPALRDEGLVVCARAAGALLGLGRVSDETIKVMLDALSDEDEIVYRNTINMLEWLDRSSDSMVRGLLAMLKDSKPKMRIRAANALGRIGSRSHSVIVALIDVAQRDKNARVREEGLRALKEMSLEFDSVEFNDVFAAFFDAWQNKDDRIREDVLLSFRDFGLASNEVQQVLLDALQDKNKRIRLRAAEALGYLKWAGGVPKKVVEALLNTMQDRVLFVRMFAAEALGMLGQTSEKVVSKVLAAAKHKDAWSRQRAIMALGNLGVTSAAIKQELVNALQDADARVRLSAVEALAKLGLASNTTARDVLIPLLQDKDESIRFRAVWIIESLGLTSPEIIRNLQKRLNDYEEIADVAFTALWQLAPKYYEQGYED